MDGFLESFIYLLITIVILVLSFRKKKPVESESEESTQTGDPFSDLFKEDEELEKEYTTESQPSTVTSGETYDSQQESPWMSETEAKEMLIDTDAIMKEAKENNPIAQFEGQVKEGAYGIGKVDPEGGIPFDLKKAVIYSEILDRRVF